MTDATSQLIDVPGGQVYYEVRGSGPLLMVIGQPMTSGPFSALAELLAADHTVVTYDPHGVGRSTVDDPGLPVTPEIEADDLAAIIDALGGPADVFGSSGGAVAGLALAVRHPGSLGTLIAHEPPVAELLPDAAAIRAAVDGVEDAYRAAGSGAGWGAFVSLVMYDGPVPDSGIPPMSWPPPGTEPAPEPADANPAPPGPPSPTAKQIADDELFFLRMLKPFTRWEAPVGQLSAGVARIVPAVGAASGDQIAARAVRALAAALGTEPTIFPGDHGGFMADPAAFASAIRQQLADR